MVKVLAQQFTYGYHPDYMEYYVRSWSDERLKHVGKVLCEKLKLSELSSIGQSYSFMKLDNYEVAFIFCRWGVKDKRGREGAYCHGIVVKNEDYKSVGANLRLFEKYFLKEKEQYEEHVRKAQERGGKVDPLQIEEMMEVNELLCEKERIEDIIYSKDTLKYIVASLLKGHKLTIYECRDVNILKVIYLLLDILPPSSRVFSFSTIPPIREYHDQFLLICDIMKYEGRKHINLKQTISFLPQDIIDEVIDYVLERCFENSSYMRQFHEKWEELKKSVVSYDPFKIAEEYYREIILKDLNFEKLIERAYNSIKSEKLERAKIEERVLWEKLLKTSELYKYIDPVSDISITLIKKQVRKIDELLDFINLLPEKERTYLYTKLIKTFPDKSTFIKTYLRNINVNNILTYLNEKHEDYRHIIPVIDLDTIERIIKTEEFTHLPSEICLYTLILYFKEIDSKSVVKGLEDFENSILYKTLLFLYKREHELDAERVKELLSNIIRKIEPNPLMLLTPIPLLLIRFTQNLKNKDDAKKLKEILNDSLKKLFDVLYDPSISNITEKMLKKLTS
jgi:hypothetical protein